MSRRGGEEAPGAEPPVRTHERDGRGQEEGKVCEAPSGNATQHGEAGAMGLKDEVATTHRNAM